MSEDGYIATQALHDIRAILGFDNDGDRTPAAQINGAGSVQAYAAQVVRDVREYVADVEVEEAKVVAAIEAINDGLGDGADVGLSKRLLRILGA